MLFVAPVQKEVCSIKKQQAVDISTIYPGRQKSRHYKEKSLLAAGKKFTAGMEYIKLPAEFWKKQEYSLFHSCLLLFLSLRCFWHR